jgi:hypothetical protein
VEYRSTRQAPGYRFRIRSDVPGIGDVLDRLLAPFTSRDTGGRSSTYVLRDRGPDGRYALDLNRGPVQRVRHAGSMIDWLVAHITRSVIDRADGIVAIHAGVVAVNGRAVILPGHPDAGKSTTVAGLVRSGFSYLTDEAALLRIDHPFVLPFPRPLMLEQGSIDVLELNGELPLEYDAFRKRMHHVAPDDLRPRAVGAPAPVGYVVAPRYRPGATTELIALSPAETLFLLARNAFNLPHVGREGFAALERLARSVPGYRLDIGHLPSAVEAVRELIAPDPMRLPYAANGGTGLVEPSGFTT